MSQSEEAALLLTRAVANSLGLDEGQRERVRAEVDAVLSNYVVLPRKKETTSITCPSPDELVKRASQQARTLATRHGREIRHRR